MTSAPAAAEVAFLEGKEQPIMSRVKRLRVRVEPGMFESERSVSFEAGGKTYTLIVDKADVQGDTLRVYVVEQRGNEALIDLPRDTFTSGTRIRVPADVLLPAA